MQPYSVRLQPRQGQPRQESSAPNSKADAGVLQTNQAVSAIACAILRFGAAQVAGGCRQTRRRACQPPQVAAHWPISLALLQTCAHAPREGCQLRWRAPALFPCTPVSSKRDHPLCRCNSAYAQREHVGTLAYGSCAHKHHLHLRQPRYRAGLHDATVANVPASHFTPDALGAWNNVERSFLARTVSDMFKLIPPFLQRLNPHFVSECICKQPHFGTCTRQPLPQSKLHCRFSAQYLYYTI
jgi:hypothetical protein